MALQATEQGRRPPAGAAAVDPDPFRRPLAAGGMGCPKRSAVAGLPDDALVEILSRLPAKPLCRFKCVSKAWCDLIADRLRCKKLPQTLEGFFYGCSAEDSSSDEEFSSEEDCDECGSNEEGDGGGDIGSEDDGYEGSSNDKKLSCGHLGHFINLFGRPVPLVDPSFSFVMKMPGIEKIILLDSCGGLLLFGHNRKSDMYDTPGYIVCNPATEHWAIVPSSGFISPALEESLDEDSDDETGVATYLIFDPVASPHFQLIELCHTPEVSVVHTYSSETGVWDDRLSERRRWKKGHDWDMHRTTTSMWGSTFFNKMLHLIVSPCKGPEVIAAVDGEGKTCRIIKWLQKRGFPVFVGQSKGLLHCVSVSGHPDGNSCHMTELSIWVLEDYDAEEWNLKHTVSFSELFGKMSCQFGSDYNVVTIHPDHNLVFLVQHWDYKLISYDMDRKEVCALCTVGCDYGIIAPYFPCFSQSPVLSKKP